MLGEFKTRRPPKNFNILYLESNEVYLMTLKASLLIDSNSEEYPIPHSGSTASSTYARAPSSSSTRASPSQSYA